MLPKLKDPDYWLGELEPLLREIHFGLKIAVPKAHGFFADYLKKPINKPLFSNLIRYYTLDYLWASGYHTAKEEDDRDSDAWGMRRLANNGIEIVYRQSCLRVRKGIEPPLSTTKTQNDFYQQVLFEDSDRIITNLMLLFDLNSKPLYDGSMRLVRPVGETRKAVKLQWAATVKLETVDPAALVSHDYSKPEDLPLDVQADAADESKEPTGTTNDN